MKEVLEKNREESAALYKTKKTNSEGRHVSGDIPFKAIDVDETGTVVAVRNIKKSSGYDENFRLETLSKLKDHDREFGLETKEVKFETAFYHSRLPTHSYIHFRGGMKKNFDTTGHSGGFFKPIVRTSSLPDIRSLSISYIKGIHGTRGENKVGSVGKMGAGSFHGEREAVIDKVIKEAKAGIISQKEASPVKATTEALKYVVTHTVGYRDDTDENRAKFRGITTDGLNLEDPISRKYALKHFQAHRDAQKLAVLKLEGRLNKDDSTETSAKVNELLTIEKRVSMINRECEKTVLSKDYHGPVDGHTKRCFSPLRYESPYSKANIEISLKMLDNAKTYQEISSVYNVAIPVIHPTAALYAKEDKLREESQTFKPIK